MEPLVDINLNDLQPRQAACMALRSAMRIVPVLAYRSYNASTSFEYWDEGETARNCLDIFDCIQAAQAALIAPRGSDCERAGRGYVSEALDRILNHPAENVASAARTSSSACTLAISDGGGFGRGLNVPDRDLAYSDAHDALEYTLEAAAAVSLSALAETLMERDLKSVRTGTPINFLQQPLWYDTTPPEILELWHTLRADLSTLRAGFDVWADWYSDRLGGGNG